MASIRRPVRQSVDPTPRDISGGERFGFIISIVLTLTFGIAVLQDPRPLARAIALAGMGVALLLGTLRYAKAWYRVVLVIASCFLIVLAIAIVTWGERAEIGPRIETSIPRAAWRSATRAEEPKSEPKEKAASIPLSNTTQFPTDRVSKTPSIVDLGEKPITYRFTADIVSRKEFRPDDASLHSLEIALSDGREVWIPHDARVVQLHDEPGCGPPEELVGLDAVLGGKVTVTARQTGEKSFTASKVAMESMDFLYECSQ